MTYIPINMDKVSIIFKTGSLEMYITQHLINSFNSVESVGCDVCLQRYVVKNKYINTKI